MGKKEKARKHGLTVEDESGKVIAFIPDTQCRDIVSTLYVCLFNAIQDNMEEEPAE